MKIGERIKYFRKLRNLTQKELGLLMGYEENTASARIFQYESGVRNPTKETLIKLADIFGISRYVFEVQDLTSELVLIHVLFDLENIWDVDIKQIDSYFSMQFQDEEAINPTLFNHLSAWREMKEKYKKGEITAEDYNEWKNTYSGIKN